MDQVLDSLTAEAADETGTALTERRAHPRRKTRFRATIVFGDERATANCIVQDLSESGARLKIDHAEAIPTDFHLIWVAERAVLEVQAVWRSRGEIGVKFKAKHNIQGRLSNELAAVCRAWERRDRVRN
jgi:hypothetical protein